MSLRKLLMFLLVGMVQAFSQDLKSDWTRIQANFLSGRHDSVVVLVEPFIQELQKRSLNPQLSVAYYHYGVSLAELDRWGSSDSAFALARIYAAKSNDAGKVKEIEFRQVQLCITMAKRYVKISPTRALDLYSKALGILGPAGDAATRGTICYERALLYKSVNDVPNAITDFESAKALLEKDPNSQALRSSIVSQLTTLYLNTNQTEKARQLTGGGTAGATRLEYTIKLASDAEQRGEPAKADALLSSIQTDMFSTQSDERILDFVKKRFSLYELQGFKATGVDTVRSMVNSLKTVGKSVSALLRAQQLLALLYVQDARVQEAAAVVDQMSAAVAKANLSPEVASLVEQTRGDVAYLQGDIQGAMLSYRAVLANSERLPRENLLTVSNNLGLALTKSGQYNEALTTFDRIVILAEADEFANSRIQADLNAGIILIKQDRVREAVERFKRAKDAAEQRTDVSLQIMASLRLAEANRRLGYDNLADDLFDEVRRQQSKLTNPFNRIQVLQALSISAKGALATQTALSDLREAFALARQIGAKGYLGTLAANLADAYFMADSLAQARNSYRVALEAYGTGADIRTSTEMRFKVGQAFLGEGRYDDARNEIIGALKLLLTTPSADPVKVSNGNIKEGELYGQGLASLAYVDYLRARRIGDVRTLLSALEEVQKAVDLLEEHQLAQLSRAQKESESVRNVNAYRLVVDIASELYNKTGDVRYFEVGFNTSEKSRAEAFVSEVGTRLITKLTNPSVKEAAKIAESLTSQAPKEASMALDITQSAGATRGLIQAQPEDSRKLEKVQSQYESIVQKLSSEDGKVAQLISVNTLNLSSLKSLVEPDEIVLSYYLSIDKCYLFAVSSSDVKLKTIEWTPEGISSAVEKFRIMLQNRASTTYREAGRVLYDSLLAPVRAEIAGKRIVIIPSGRLNTLPFGALWDGQRFVLEDFDVTIIPNASTLQFIRSGKKLSASPSVLALGNPANPNVSRLPGTENEVNTVKTIFPGCQVFVGQEATETNAKEKMGSFEIVHIASHGLFNYEFPLLSCLALAPDAQNDGFLQVHELYNLNLVNTNLVLLSACETGLSQIRKNDDVIGLVRGFLYAGVPSIVASLWKVDDYATSVLMSNFHALLKLRNTKCEALRKAQLQVMRTQATSHPFFWADFVLYGNAK